MQRDLLEVGEGQTMAQAVEELAKKDLQAVKVASEMFKDAALTNALGAAEKIASDKTRIADGRIDGVLGGRPRLPLPVDRTTRGG